VPKLAISEGSLLSTCIGAARRPMPTLSIYRLVNLLATQRAGRLGEIVVSPS
jgi:hypothetical protein